MALASLLNLHFNTRLPLAMWVPRLHATAGYRSAGCWHWAGSAGTAARGWWSLLLWMLSCTIDPREHWLGSVIPRGPFQPLQLCDLGLRCCLPSDQRQQVGAGGSQPTLSCRCVPCHARARPPLPHTAFNWHSHCAEVAEPSMGAMFALHGASATGGSSVETDVGSNKHLFL